MIILKMRIQKIILENGEEVYINHDFKEECINCKKEIVWGYVPLELVGLAKWNKHICKKENEKKEVSCLQ
jgi:hypothetical protein